MDIVPVGLLGIIGRLIFRFRWSGSGFGFASKSGSFLAFWSFEQISFGEEEKGGQGKRRCKTKNHPV